LTKIERGPQALTERAQRVLRNLGYADSPADEAIGYTTDVDYLRYIDENDRSGARWRALATAHRPRSSSGTARVRGGCCRLAAPTS
jgi:hypothetical protein